MNLWVRNQDKTILQRVDNLLISDGDNVERTFNIYTNSLPAQNVLGRYKPKERAIEILDEIQMKINNIANMDDENFINIVYEMPEK